MPPASTTHPRILAAVRRIPRGRVSTYGWIAELAGFPRQPRLVGYALHHSSDDTVPWHRVVNARGEVSLRTAGESHQRQRTLLEKEGISFSPTGRIDLARYGWRGCPSPSVSSASPAAPHTPSRKNHG